LSELNIFNQKNLCKIGLATIAVALLLFIPRLTLELGLDELGSYWVVKDSLKEVIGRSIHIQGQSPLYYSILWASTGLFGFSALGLRVFSVFCTLISCLLIFQLGQLLFNRKVGLYSVFCFLCCSQVIESATNARPYALAITLGLAASVALVQWCRTQSTKWLVSYGFLLVATVYAHYLYALVILIHTPWLFINTFRSEPKKRSIFLKQIVLLALFGIIALIPSVFQLHILSTKGAGLSFAEFPTLIALIKTLFPADILLLIGLVFAFELTIWRHSRPNFSERDGSNVGLIFICLFLLLPPVIIYIISYVSGHSIFIERYYSVRAVGIGLLGGVILASISSTRNQITLVVALIAMIAISQYAFITGERAKEGWESAASTIANLDHSNECTVFLLTGFIEGQTVKWLSDDMVSDFIRSPVAYYKLKNKTFLLPYTFDTNEGQKYYLSVIESKIQRSRCIWLLYRNAELFITGKKLNPSPIFLQDQLSKNGFRASEMSKFGLVELIHFDRNVLQSDGK
jgi:uncharacterized membrane protein